VKRAGMALSAREKRKKRRTIPGIRRLRYFPGNGISFIREGCRDEAFMQPII
jgi:hypothetical protein